MAGIPEKQANAIAQTLLEIKDSELATKEDIALLKVAIVQAKYDLIYWVVGAFVLTNIVQIAASWMRH